MVVDVTSDSNAAPNSTGHLVLPKKTYNVDTQEEVVVPDDVKEAIEGFNVPQSMEVSGKVEQGHIYSWGVYVVPSAGSRKEPRFYCLACVRCRREKTVIPCKNGDRSNVGKHLKALHKLVSQASLSQRRNSGEVEEGSAQLAAASRVFGVGRER